MTTIDYASVKREELEMHREPRKSQFTVVHKPSGAVATDPVVPGSLTPARFRRPSNLPKENRVAGMEGYIESTSEDDKQFFLIIEAAENRAAQNQYLDALAGDPAALQRSFEGPAKTASEVKAAGGQQTAPEAASEAPAPERQAESQPGPTVPEPEEVPADAPEPAEEPTPAESGVEEPAPVGAAVGDSDDLDDLLAGLDS